MALICRRTASFPGEILRVIVTGVGIDPYGLVAVDRAAGGDQD